MHAETAQLLDYYREHLAELAASGRITDSEHASATHHAEAIAHGRDPFASVADGAEDYLRDA